MFAPLARRLWLAICARLGRCAIEWMSAAHGDALLYGLHWSWRPRGAVLHAIAGRGIALRYGRMAWPPERRIRPHRPIGDLMP